MIHTPTFAQRVHGCLLAGALGNAIGRQSAAAAQPGGSRAPVRSFGRETQLTLYTVDGLLDALEWANGGVAADETACLWLAYLRWARSQGVEQDPSLPVPPARWLDAQPVMHRRLLPSDSSGALPDSTLAGLERPEMGTRHRPVNTASGDAGALARSAPFGLLPHLPSSMLDRLVLDAAALSHGHPQAQSAAVVFAGMIHSLVGAGSCGKQTLEAAIQHAESLGDPTLAGLLRSARQYSGDGTASIAEVLPAPKSAWSAGEELAVAVWAVLGARGEGPAAKLENALERATSHDFPAATTGSLAGNLAGALYGAAALPSTPLETLDGADVLRQMAASFVTATSPAP